MNENEFLIFTNTVKISCLRLFFLYQQGTINSSNGMLQCIKDGKATFSKRGKETILGSGASAANIVDSMNASPDFGKQFFKVSNTDKWESVANILLSKASNTSSPPAEFTAEMMDAIWGNAENISPNISDEERREIEKNKILVITKDIRNNALQEAVIKHCLQSKFSSNTIGKPR